MLDDDEWLTEQMKRFEAYRTYLVLEISASFIFRVIFTVNMIYQVTVVGLEPLQLVLVGTMLETTVFLFEVPTGVVADVFSRRLSIVIGYAILGLGFVVEGSIPQFRAVLLGQFLWGLGYTFTSGATQAWITDEIGEDAAGQAFLRGSQAGQVGALFGILVSAVLGSLDVRIPIVAGGGSFIILALVLAFIMPEAGFKPIPSRERNSVKNMARTFRAGLAMIRLRPVLITILVIGLFYGLYSEGYDRLWTKHLLDQFAFPTFGFLTLVGWFGLIQVVEILLSTVATEIVRRRLETTSQGAIVRLMMGLTALLSGAMLAFAWVGSLWVAVGMVWLVGAARTLIGPIYTTWVNQRLDSSVRATVISMSSQADAIGQIAGGPGVGLIGNLVSVRAAISTSALILTPLLLIFARIQKKSRSAEEALPAD